MLYIYPGIICFMIWIVYYIIIQMHILDIKTDVEDEDFCVAFNLLINNIMPLAF